MDWRNRYSMEKTAIQLDVAHVVPAVDDVLSIVDNKTNPIKQLRNGLIKGVADQTARRLHTRWVKSRQEGLQEPEEHTAENEETNPQ